MGSIASRIYTYGTHILLIVLGASFVGWRCWSGRAALIEALPVLALLAPCTALAAWAVAGRASLPVPVPRLAASFLLTAFWVAPGPGALLVAVFGFAAGLGAGVLGPTRRDGWGMLALLGSVWAAGQFHDFIAGGLAPASPAALAELGLLFGLLHVLSWTLLRAAPRSPETAEGAPQLQVMPLVEWVNVPLAWLLVTLLTQSITLPSLALCGSILLAGAGLRQLVALRYQRVSAQDRLDARMTELDTIHAIARETLATLDPRHIFPVVERECRKIFEIDTFCFASLDRKSRELELVYCSPASPSPRSALGPLDYGLATTVIHEKRGLRLDDAHAAGSVPPDSPRSILAVPLLVEDEVTGVLCIQSARAKAYDDHQLSVLTTIAQQVAVAVENATHYEMATIDALTGLYLRPYFFRRLEEERTRAERYRTPFALLMLDLDGFKEINDRHGHLAGDRYLRELGATIREGLRGADLACRYGGDEFCLLLPETELVGAQIIAERIRAAVAELVVDVDTVGLRTTASIGVATFPGTPEQGINGLLRRADEALYQAKRLGRDRVVPPAA